jgi:hypothetical protein
MRIERDWWGGGGEAACDDKNQGEMKRKMTSALSLSAVHNWDLCRLCPGNKKGECNIGGPPQPFFFFKSFDLSDREGPSVDFLVRRLRTDCWQQCTQVKPLATASDWPSFVSKNSQTFINPPTTVPPPLSLPGRTILIYFRFYFVDCTHTPHSLLFIYTNRKTLSVCYFAGTVSSQMRSTLYV